MFQSQSLKKFVACGLLLVALGSVIAAPASANITYDSNAFEESANSKQIILYGDVTLTVKNKIKITTDKAAVNFADKEHRKISQFIIYGDGTYVEKDKTIHFKNGTFDPNTLKLSAEKMITNG